MTRLASEGLAMDGPVGQTAWSLSERELTDTDEGPTIFRKKNFINLKTLHHPEPSGTVHKTPDPQRIHSEGQPRNE
jgi:hypothetical protein